MNYLSNVWKPIVGFFIWLGPRLMPALFIATFFAGLFYLIGIYDMTDRTDVFGVFAISSYSFYRYCFFLFVSLVIFFRDSVLRAFFDILLRIHIFLSRFFVYELFCEFCVFLPLSVTFNGYIYVLYYGFLMFLILYDFRMALCLVLCYFWGLMVLRVNMDNPFISDLDDISDFYLANFDRYIPHALLSAERKEEIAAVVQKNRDRIKQHKDGMTQSLDRSLKDGVHPWKFMFFNLISSKYIVDVPAQYGPNYFNYGQLYIIVTFKVPFEQRRWFRSSPASQGIDDFFVLSQKGKAIATAMMTSLKKLDTKAKGLSTVGTMAVTVFAMYEYHEGRKLDKLKENNRAREQAAADALSLRKQAADERFRVADEEYRVKKLAYKQKKLEYSSSWFWGKKK